jgi:FtsZ-binding cell division protein ZapB
LTKVTKATNEEIENLKVENGELTKVTKATNEEIENLKVDNGKMKDRVDEL